jgi:hypothetical protein
VGAVHGRQLQVSTPPPLTAPDVVPAPGGQANGKGDARGYYDCLQQMLKVGRLLGADACQLSCDRAADNPNPYVCALKPLPAHLMNAVHECPEI